MFATIKIVILTYVLSIVTCISNINEKIAVFPESAEDALSCFIKNCCITSRQEASWAVQVGADAIGLVSHMPSGPGVIADELIADIAAHIAAQVAAPPPGDTAGDHHKAIKTFLLTSRQSVAAISAQHAVCNTTTLQLVDEVAPQELLALRKLLPEVELVQVIHVTGEDALQRALAGGAAG